VGLAPKLPSPEIVRSFPLYGGAHGGALESKRAIYHQQSRSKIGLFGVRGGKEKRNKGRTGHFDDNKKKQKKRSATKQCPWG